MTATAATSDATFRTELQGLLLRPVPRQLPAVWRAAVLGAVVAGAGMVAASAAIHLHLWFLGYRHIHLIGPAFLFQAVSGLLLAAVLLTWHRLAVVAAGTLFLAGSVLALLLSATVGFLGLHDGLGVPWAGWSLVTEVSGLLLLTGAGAVMLRRR